LLNEPINFIHVIDEICAIREQQDFCK